MGFSSEISVQLKRVSRMHQLWNKGPYYKMDFASDGSRIQWKTRREFERARDTMSNKETGKLKAQRCTARRSWSIKIKWNNRQDRQEQGQLWVTYSVPLDELSSSRDSDFVSSSSSSSSSELIIRLDFFFRTTDTCFVPFTDFAFEPEVPLTYDESAFLFPFAVDLLEVLKFYHFTVQFTAKAKCKSSQASPRKSQWPFGPHLQQIRERRQNQVK